MKGIKGAIRSMPVKRLLCLRAQMQSKQENARVKKIIQHEKLIARSACFSVHACTQND